VHAKRAILPEPTETCGVWPYDKNTPAGDTFIVGYDERGNLVELPAVADGPDFLQTVHFDRAVLEPYYGDPNKYRVRDGLVQGPTWTIPIDNDHPDRVIAYLGDLGKLPLFEQKRWKPHNIEPDGTLSETAFRRDVLAESADGTGPVWMLVAAREKANEAFRSRYGVPLYQKPQPEDQHVEGSIHVPTNDSVLTFDRELISLAKYTTDLLNERGIEAQVERWPN
jgi:hypothetical protein